MDAKTKLKRAGILEALGRLGKALPGKGMDADRADIYAEELMDLPVEAIEAACKQILRTSNFIPTIAEIREMAAPPSRFMHTA